MAADLELSDLSPLQKITLRRAVSEQFLMDADVAERNDRPVSKMLDAFLAQHGETRTRTLITALVDFKNHYVDVLLLSPGNARKQAERDLTLARHTARLAALNTELGENFLIRSESEIIHIALHQVNAFMKEIARGRG